MRTTNINRLSLANRANVIPFTGLGINKVKLKTDWDVNLNIETVDLSGIQEPDCIKDQQSYDQCIISQFLQNGNNSRYSELFILDATHWSSKLQMVPSEVIEEYFATIISSNALNKCTKSCSYMQVGFDQKANRKHLKMQNMFLTRSNLHVFHIPQVMPSCKLMRKQKGTF